MNRTDQPQWQRISGTAAGTTTLISGREGFFHRVIIPTQKEGTVTFYDVNGATTSASEIAAISEFGAGTIPQHVDMGFRVRNGLVAVSGGTTDLVVVYE